MEFNATFLATIISFIIFVYLMRTVLYEPIQKIIDERVSYFETNSKIASDNKNKAAKLSNEKELRIADTRNIAKKNYVEAINLVTEQKKELINTAQNNIKEDLKVNSEQLLRLSDEMKSVLKLRISNLANDIVEKITGQKSVDNNYNDDIVNKVLYH